ncbi:MAG: type III pantothenate kinase [Sinobacteraceae bacterium]|nr:type III pantothenate kinase [Nevskiaceae bacterium]
MMKRERVLLVDLGNTRIKWAWLRRDGELGRMRAAEHAGWSAKHFAKEIFARVPKDSSVEVHVVSVAGVQVRTELRKAVRASTGRWPRLVSSVRALAGVQNGYRDPWRLGADRWLALLGARELQRPRSAVCVADIGTALTLDLLDAGGVHRGGAIVPGPQLMTDALLRSTGGIRRRARRGLGRARELFARDTRSALAAGAHHAAAAVIERALAEARGRKAPRKRVELLLTGGAALQVSRLLRVPHRLEASLVLRGLARAVRRVS